MANLLSYLWELILVVINLTELHICQLLKLYFLLPPSNFSLINIFLYFNFLFSFSICKGSIILLANWLGGKNLDEDSK